MHRFPEMRIIVQDCKYKNCMNLPGTLSTLILQANRYLSSCNKVSFFVYITTLVKPFAIPYAIPPTSSCLGECISI